MGKKSHIGNDVLRIVGVTPSGGVLDSKRDDWSEMNNMALNVTPIHRNLHTRVTFMCLEFEDLFVILGLAAVMNVLSRFVAGQLSGYVQYGVPLSVVPFLMIFKYGKPRGYIRDLFLWHTKPRSYCAAARDSRLRSSYIEKESQ